jgi:hypothetical protein
MCGPALGFIGNGGIAGWMGHRAYKIMQKDDPANPPASANQMQLGNLKAMAQQQESQKKLVAAGGQAKSMNLGGTK